MIDIPRDVQTRLYELTYLLPSGLTETELSTAKTSIEKLIAKHKGKIVRTEDWGKLELAYKIRHAGKRQTEAVYTHYVLEFLPENAFKFEKELYLQDVVMRHLLVKIEADSKEKLD